MQASSNSLGKKMTALVLTMAVTMGIATVFFGYRSYKNTLLNHYITTGRNCTTAVVQLLEPDRLDIYLAGLQTDTHYDSIQTAMQRLCSASIVENIYVLKPLDRGFAYIFSTEEDPSTKLGEYLSFDEEISRNVQSIAVGEQINTFAHRENQGWVVTVYEPIYYSTGQLAAYVRADFYMDSLLHAQMKFLVTLALVSFGCAVAFIVLYLHLIRKNIVEPINEMAKAADDFLVSDPMNGGGCSKEQSSLARLEIHSGDELERLAIAMKSMEAKIAEYIESLDQAIKRAETDVLTGLDNREAFYQKVNSFLKVEDQAGHVHAFYMLDIDNFKSINDTYGHVVGDEVLRDCAKALRQVFRSSDIIARVGGDEFAVFCMSIDRYSVIEEKAQQVCKAWQAIVVKDGTLHISASIGISLAPFDGNGYDKLYQKADDALYKAKVAGKSRFVFSKEASANGFGEMVGSAGT